MISSEVQRTLVKSPPELWAEISDPEALARHLGEFGEIRITRVQPEQKVEWEAPEASGSILIKPSGWGTKVKLTVTRELSEATPNLEPDAGEESEPRDELEPAERESLTEGKLAESELAEEQLDEAEDSVAASSPLEAHEDQLEDDPPAEPADMSDSFRQSEPEAEPARRLGFFARLFGRRRGARTATGESAVHAPEIAEDVEEHAEPTLVADLTSAPDQPPTLAAEVALVETELDAEPVEHAPPSDAHADIAAQLECAEEAAQEQVTAVLTGVLDRLGAAHHRPFSRA